MRGLIVVLSLLSITAASAASHPSPPANAPTPQSIAPLAAAIDDADARIQAVAAGARSRTISDASLRQSANEIPAIQGQLQDALAALQPRMQAADARLAELGPAPAPGQPAEDPEVAQERQNILRFRKAVDTEIKLGRLVSVEGQQLQDSLATRRRTLFSERLWRRDASPLDPGFWSRAASALTVDAAHIGRLLREPGGAPYGTARPDGALIVWIFDLLAAVAIAVPLRIALNRMAIRRARVAKPTRLHRSMLALWLVMAAVLTTLLAGLIGRAVLTSMIGGAPADLLAALIVRALVFASLFAALGRALFAPAMPLWRLGPLSDVAAKRIKYYPAAIGLAAAAATLVGGTIQVLGMSEASAAALRCLALIAEMGTIGMGLSVVTRAAAQPVGMELENQNVGLPAKESRLPWVIAALCAWVALGVALVAILLGYLSFAAFLIGEMVWIATMLAILFLLVRFVDDLFPALAAPRRRTGRFLHASVDLSPAALEQLGVLLSGAARLTLLLFGWTAILAPFGAGAGDVLERLTSTELAFHLGQVAISPGTIVGGLLVFLVAIAITRGVRRWLEVRYLPKTAMDIGARAALSAGIGYVGAVVAIIIASSYLGLSLDRITLLASALSVGIGFGLQSVISNFVSGLILLAERPVKVGDWIAIGDLEGDVKRISVRATEIEMRDRSKLIVPNSDLISKTVRNITHGSSLGRLKIALRVNDDTDPAAMRSLLVAGLQDHPDILSEPSAAVFMDGPPLTTGAVWRRIRGEDHD